MMNKMPDKNDIGALAAWLNESSSELVARILDRHTAGILGAVKEYAEENKARISELESQNEHLLGLLKECEQRLEEDRRSGEIDLLQERVLQAIAKAEGKGTQ